MRYRIILIVSFLFYSYAALVPRANAGIDNKRSQVERTMGADPRAMISICLISGSLTIQGWDRNEVQVRANDAPPVELRRLDQTGRERATEVRLVTQNESVRGRSCVAFGNIVLKAPRQANLTVETSDAEIKVLNAANVVARSQAGSVSLDRVRGQIDANTIGGDLSVDNSEGMIGLHTVSGSIRASNLKPAETEDRFEATAVSGDITLERVAHQDLRAKTVEGSISYSGALVKNGRYSFQRISEEANRLSAGPRNPRRWRGIGSCVVFQRRRALTKAITTSVPSRAM